MLKRIAGWMPAGLEHWLRKRHYPGVLRRFDESKWPEAVVIRKLVREGDTVVDAGANIGYLSMLLARMVGKTGRVLSLEPVPRTFDLLVHNIRQLDLAQVDARQLAVSSRTGVVRMVTPRGSSGLANLYESHVVEGADGEGVAVKCTPLDDLLSGIPSVPFVKMDVEGHELDAILGCLATIDRVGPAFLIEISGNPDDPQSNAGKLFALMQSRGYTIHVFESGTVRLRRTGDKCVDYFLLQTKHLAAL